MNDRFKYSVPIPAITGWNEEKPDGTKVWHSRGPSKFFSWLQRNCGEARWTCVFGGFKPHVRFMDRHSYIDFQYYLEENIY